MLKTRKTKVSWQAFPSLLPRAPLSFLSRLKLPFPKLPFPSLSNACHAGYFLSDENDENSKTGKDEWHTKVHKSDNGQNLTGITQAFDTQSLTT